MAEFRKYLSTCVFVAIWMGYSFNGAMWLLRVIVTHGTEMHSIYRAIGALLVSAGCTYNYQTMGRLIRRNHYPKGE